MKKRQGSDRYIFAGKSLDAKEAPECATDDDYRLAEPENFSEFSKLIESGAASEQHHEEFTLSLIQHFIDSVYGGRTPEAWVSHALADAFMKVIQGGRWEDEFPLPWTKVELPWTAAEWRALDLYKDIADAVRSDPLAPVTAVIKRVAATRGVSFETARAAYYKHKGRLKSF